MGRRPEPRLQHIHLEATSITHVIPQQLAIKNNNNK